MGKEGPKDRAEMDRPEMVSREPKFGKEGPKDRLEMVSREPTWAKKVPRIDKRWFQESQLGQRRFEG